MAVDIGNTSISIGIFKEKKLISDFFISTASISSKSKEGDSILSGEIFSSIKKRGDIPGSVALCSVVPKISCKVYKVLNSLYKVKPYLIDINSSNLISSFIADKETIGMDRIANATAAIDIYSPPLIIVDMGTATTFCAIDSKARYLGGAISAGLKIGCNALFNNTGKLPEVELIQPSGIIGLNTHDNILSGTILGHACMIDEMVKRMEKEMNEKVKIILTGGYADFVVPFCNNIFDIRKKLTLEGIQMIYDINK